MLEWESSFILQHLVNPHMNRHIRTFFTGLLTLALTACATFADTAIQDMATATETPLPATPTIIWFPPSPTPSPQALPTQEATPERRPGVGSVLFTDDFSSAADWNTAVSDDASVDVSHNRLTIAVQPGFAPVVSFRKDLVFSNFYVEITARPSLCRAADDYGLLFRAPNNIAYYRFSLACNGTTGAARVSVGTPHVLESPIFSGDVPPGAPGEVRLGVWAVGPEMRFFLNGRYQFSVSDKSYPAGAIGVFAHSAGDTPVTVTFSDLVVHEVDDQPPALTPQP